MNDFLFNIIKKWKVLLIIALVIYLIVFIANHYKNVISLYQDVKEFIIKKPDSEIKKENYIFLMFPNKDLFDKWNADINFKSGLPKYSRNADNDQIDTIFKTLTYTKWISHPNTNDKRGICSFDHASSLSNLFDSLAEEKYHFTKITHRKAENIGFISDIINLNKKESYKHHLKQFKLDIKYNKFKTPLYHRKIFDKFTGFNFDIFLIPRLDNVKRNKYFFDYGQSLNKNRISFYFNRDNNLVFRVIDNNSNGYFLVIFSDFNNKWLGINFKYHIKTDILEITINNDKSISQKYSKIKFDFDSTSPKRACFGNCLFCSFYGFKGNIRYCDIENVKYMPSNGKHLIKNIFRIDDNNEKNTYVDDNSKTSGYIDDSPVIEIY